MCAERPNGSAVEPAREEGRRRGGWLLGLAKVALAALIIYILLRRGDIQPAQLRSALGSHPLLTVLVFVLMTLSYMGQGYRWDVILRDRSVPASYWQAFRYLMIGKFFNLAIPGYFSEDIVRGVYLARTSGAPRSKVFMSLMVDRFVGIISLFMVCSGGLAMRLLWGRPGDGHDDLRLAALRTMVVLITGGCVALVLVLRLVPRPPAPLRSLAARWRLLQALDSAHTELHYYCCTGRLQLKMLGISLVNHSLMVLSFVAFGYALGISSVSIADYCVFVPLGMLITMIPIAPVGLGVGHLAFLSLFRMAGSPEGANLFSLFTAVCILINLSGGLFYLGIGKSVEQVSGVRSQVSEPGP
jgi:uncharacterized membrane protein YbhN (UPF0104 family)